MRSFFFCISAGSHEAPKGVIFFAYVAEIMIDMFLSCSTQCFTYMLVNGIVLQNPGFVGLSDYGMHNRGR